MIQWMSCVEPATKLPIANTSMPSTIIGLRPQRSEAMPSGTCRQACIRP